MSNTGLSSLGEAQADEGSRGRWEEMLGSLTGLLPRRSRCVLIDGPAEQARLFASRLVEKLAGQQGTRSVQVTLEAGGDWDVAIFLRTAPGGRHSPVYRKEREDRKERENHKERQGREEREHQDGKELDERCRREREERADVVVDLHDVRWPVIRRVAAPLAGCGPWYLTETRAFFACRAATWDARFGDDLPAYSAAVAEAGIRRGGVVIDVGCGTGRALPPLREAVGPAGKVIAMDMTPEMLVAARPAIRLAGASVLIADARALPFADGSADAIFAAGLVNHLPDTEAGLRGLARVTRPGACSCSSTRPAVRRLPPGTATRFPPTSPSPRARCAGSRRPPAGS